MPSGLTKIRGCGLGGNGRRSSPSSCQVSSASDRLGSSTPGKLFWSVAVYDARTRSQIQADQAKALLSSLFDFGDAATASSVDLFFGPGAPAGHENRWIQTLPGVGWFVYFRIYGPEQAAFDKTWKPGDFEPQT